VESERKYSTLRILNIATAKREITLAEKHKGLSKESAAYPEESADFREHSGTESGSCHTHACVKEKWKTKENKIKKYAIAHFVSIRAVSYQKKTKKPSGQQKPLFFIKINFF
jgi:hypothetical protein